ncbi:glycosyltransferase family 9 protein [Mixta tenebrionis]|uniref:Glycosyltransferase family 9 protein n=1 Tax=Mixta tenebrionis TaxID=2562439 RepID=A0A506V3R0_9GAMM|nr:glycosyltransferase family 9 protein [Mixta tenebrionis]TPW40524.1 glycosyltransferase family 9 protein [Mixta tenebrionis]
MDKGVVNKILVIRIDFLGDMVCTTPLLHALRVRWPHAEIHVLANKYNAAVLENSKDINKIHYYVYSKNFQKNIRPGFLHYLIDRAKLIVSLRKYKFDLLIIPNGGMNKNAIGFAKWLNVADCRWHNADTEFDDRLQEHVATRPMDHEALSGFKLLPELGVPDISQLRLYLQPRAELISAWRQRFKDKTKPRIGFFISNNNAARRWAWDKWQALTDKLAGDYELLIFHSPQEHFPVGWRDGSSAQRISTPTVPELLAAMTQLDCVVSADSAPVHFASALQIPVVALFESRPEKYLRWHPLGVKHIILHEGKRVEDIKVQSVLLAIQALFSDESDQQNDISQNQPAEAIACIA